MGRQVKKGEKGITILAPVPIRFDEIIKNKIRQAEKPPEIVREVIKTSVIKKLHEKKVAIAKRSGKPVSKYLEQQMINKRARK